MTRAAIHARLSKDAEQLGLSVARQERECRALAGQEGLEVVEVYVDDDLSAYNRRRPRPSYLRLLEEVRSGRIETILARHEDRLLRDIREGEDLIDLVERTKVRVVLLDGQVNLYSAWGRCDFRSAINRARYESERKSERLKLTHAALAAQRNRLWTLRRPALRSAEVHQPKRPAGLRLPRQPEPGQARGLWWGLHQRRPAGGVGDRGSADGPGHPRPGPGQPTGR